METIRIQDDLYTYVNQAKLDELVIPDDMPVAGGFAARLLLLKLLHTMHTTLTIPTAMIISTTTIILLPQLPLLRQLPQQLLQSP